MFRVLVIDDNQDMRELMQVVLEGAGYAVDLAGDGDEGFAAQRARPVDLVITDIFMPNQDGIETIARLRTEYPALKVIAVSGGGSLLQPRGYLITARELGAHAVLEKPFDPDDLLRTVCELLQ